MLSTRFVLFVFPCLLKIAGELQFKWVQNSANDSCQLSYHLTDLAYKVNEVWEWKLHLCQSNWLFHCVIGMVTNILSL